MLPVSTINTVLEWEKRLEYEDQKRKFHPNEPYVNYLAAPQPARKEPKPSQGTKTYRIQWHLLSSLKAWTARLYYNFHHECVDSASNGLIPGIKECK